MALEGDQVKANVILPILNKCVAKEHQRQRSLSDHLWIYVYKVYPNGTQRVLFIASCTDGYLGKYPIFVFSPIPYAYLDDNKYVPAIRLLATRMVENIDPSRVYSIFGPEVVTRKLAAMWTRRTRIPEVPEPYYHAKISYLRPQDLVDTNVAIHPNDRIRIRPAHAGDIPQIAQLCWMFAQEGPPFTLSERRALREAQILHDNGEVWVYTVRQSGQPEESARVASIVAFTRNTNVMATITKVYTHPDFRGQRRAEQLVREVCRYLFSTGKTSIALFVGIENKAANVYHRVGFLGLGRHDPVMDGIDPWIEIGFDRNCVELGHW
ncbi:hypothetical protein BDN70DRAFT_807583 [Pholiota conissans]|uniref:N-acetyltransferase domain-containing protein n=1 Tax=Pholiota conissans TaxID=109636 RepID=A0A9P6CU20_9AGAR|nr:hypothetical protein BDN70DRAFT_807583 [Pholiota conissans]